jgi:very-short-patch-repair endonuclease
MVNYSTFRLVVKSELKIDLQPEFRFCERRWKFDFAAPDIMLAIEVEGGIYTGGRHTRGTGFVKDMEKYNTATAMGWKVLRFTPDQLLTDYALKMIEKVKKFA